MKRDILKYKRKVSGCCPGHDDYPDDKYGNRRSAKARSRDKKKEHQHARSLSKREILNKLDDLLNENNI